MIRLTQSQVIKNSDLLKSYLKSPLKENQTHGEVVWVGAEVKVTYRDKDACYYYEFTNQSTETMVLLKLQL
jgi:saccharopine dehydrogenase-like NADP-dependent oxidoreductase